MLTKFVTLIYVKPDHSANNERDERRNGSSAAAVLREMKVGKGLVLKSPTNLLAVMTAVNAADQDRFLIGQNHLRAACQRQAGFAAGGN
jgi:hypothetical protein